MNARARAFLWIAAGLGLAALVFGGTPQGRAVVARVAQSLGGRKSGPRWERLHPELRARALEVERIAAERGLPVMFWDGWRSPEASAANIAAGTSRVKDPLSSLHVWGLAADFVFRSSLGMPSWPADTDPRWRQLAEVIEAAGLRSGGLMWGWDWPHAQMPGYTAAGLRGQWGADYLAFIQSSGALA